ncbi:transposase, partial [Paraburkholderia sp. JHI2823]|uniref:transposase n=1 Tax=Paraburkholderia sp. JHI2823 TaxID=3112960 RepID=UPI0031769D73
PEIPANRATDDDGREAVAVIKRFCLLHYVILPPPLHQPDRAIGMDKRDEIKDKTVKWLVAAKRGKIKAMQEGPLKNLVIALEKTKAQIRVRVEHPFHIIKNLFRHRKMRYKGLAKNTAQLFSLFGVANLVIARNLLR